MKYPYYLFNVLGTRGTFQLEMHEHTHNCVMVVAMGLDRAFPGDTVTVHEVTKELRADKVKIRKIYPKS